MIFKSILIDTTAKYIVRKGDMKPWAVGFRTFPFDRSV